MTTDTEINHITEALQILIELGMPDQQQNERSALCLLALLDLTPDKNWAQAENPLIGITPIMEWVDKHYQKEYAPNSRETIRRFSMHQFIDAGIAIPNPDDSDRAVNSPHFVYQVEPETLSLLRKYGTPQWVESLNLYQRNHKKLVDRYAKKRQLNKIPVHMSNNEEFFLSPGKHNELIKAIIEEFAPVFLPGSILIYVGDTGEKRAHFDEGTLYTLGVTVDMHGKMPDVVFYDAHRNWLVLVESVTSHGPVDAKRHEELRILFGGSTAALVYVTAFLNRSMMSRYLTQISWETEVWIAEAPSHLIHFNGDKFLGPHKQ